MAILMGAAKREARRKDHADEGRLIKNSPSSIWQGF
jgi:hypothetical protein